MPDQFYEPMHSRTNGLHGEKNFGGAGGSRHLRFCNSRAFEAGDAAVDLRLHEWGKLMRFDMRPQTIGTAGDFDHAQNIRFRSLAINEQGGRRDLGFVSDEMPRLAHMDLWGD
jgi:hypothetical protein